MVTTAQLLELGSKLLPCRCGGIANINKDFYGEGFMVAVSCDKCQIAAVEVYTGAKLEDWERLVNCWNKVMAP